MTTEMLGLHHMTAVAGDVQKNVDFDAGVMGSRLVKQTVDFDAPTASARGDVQWTDGVTSE